MSACGGSASGATSQAATGWSALRETHAQYGNPGLGGVCQPMWFRDGPVRMSTYQIAEGLFATVQPRSRYHRVIGSSREAIIPKYPASAETLASCSRSAVPTP